MTLYQVTSSSLVRWSGVGLMCIYGVACGQEDASRNEGDPPFAVRDASDALFAPDQVREYRLTIPRDNGPPSSWSSINAQAEADGCVAQERDYYAGDITVDGATFAEVGIRTKGGCGSSRTLDQKSSFKVKLDWDADPTDSRCADERRYLDRKSLTLNNGVQDSSALREHLSFYFYARSGVPAPRTAAAQVYVNDEYYGVYQLIETVDRAFLKRWFDTRAGKGAMYEGSYGCDFLSGAGEFRDGTCWEQEFDLDACSDPPAPEDDLQFNAAGTAADDGWRFGRELAASLQAIQAQAAYYPAVTQLVDWDRFLAYWAASVVLYDWDNYIGFQNNFRIYREPKTSLWTIIPWGVDQTWGAGTNWFGRGNGGGFGGGPRDPSAFDTRADLARLCLEATGEDEGGSTCRERYAAALWKAVRQFEEIDWHSVIDTWVERLEPVMQQDGDRRSYSIEQWRRNIDDLRRYADERPSQLRTQLTAAGYEEP